MRFLLAALLLFPSLAQAQDSVYSPAPTVKGRPNVAILKDPFPLVLIDEASLPTTHLWTVPFPKGAWNQAVHCLARMGVPMSRVGQPPTLTIVPFAKTFRVRDLTVDSIMVSVDSTAQPGGFSPPTIGYALFRSGTVLVAERYRKNNITLRHEAIHFILWRTIGLFGHLPPTIKYFLTCDTNYGD